VISASVTQGVEKKTLPGTAIFLTVDRKTYEKVGSTFFIPREDMEFRKDNPKMARWRYPPVNAGTTFKLSVAFS
jgi:hypothetical protein